MCNAWFLTVLLLLGLPAARPATAASIADFTDYSLRNANGQVVLPGRLYTPLVAAAGPRPLMVFLHGGGASGTNNLTQIEHLPDPMLEEAKQRGAFLYAPQTAGNWSADATIDAVMAMIDRVVAEQNADASRLYATGYSNGGGGTWNLLHRHSGRFAAAIAVSGVAPAPGFDAANLLGTAILAIHARDDATVPVTRSRTVVSGILAAAGEPAPAYPAAGNPLYYLVSNPSFQFHRDLAASAPPGSTINYQISRADLDLIYFEQTIGGHAGMGSALGAPPLYDWLFAHTLAIPEPGTAPLAACGISALVYCRHRRRSGARSLAPWG